MMWGFGFGWIGMLLLWALVIGVIAWAAGQLAGGSLAGTPIDGARRTLDERFARGELDTGEYRQLRDELAR